MSKETTPDTPTEGENGDLHALREYEEGWKLATKLDKLDAKISIWENVPVLSVTEQKEKEDRLEQLRLDRESVSHQLAGESILQENIAARTPEELVEQMRKQGIKDDKIIAEHLKTTFPKISPYEIGGLLPANPGTVIEYDSQRDRGRRLLGQK